MPNFNQTGPLGQGPMTGRRMGRCTNYSANQKNVNSDSEKDLNENSQNLPLGRCRGMRYGRGLGRGRGYGMGRQNRFRGGV